MILVNMPHVAYDKPGLVHMPHFETMTCRNNATFFLIACSVDMIKWPSLHATKPATIKNFRIMALTVRHDTYGY